MARLDWPHLLDAVRTIFPTDLLPLRAALTLGLADSLLMFMAALGLVSVERLLALNLLMPRRFDLLSPFGLVSLLYPLALNLLLPRRLDLLLMTLATQFRRITIQLSIMVER